MWALPRASAADKVCPQTAIFLFLVGKGHLLTRVSVIISMLSYTTCKNVRYSKRVFFKKVKEWIFEKIPLEGAEFTKGHSWWRKQLLKSSVIAAMRCLQRAAPLILSDIRLLQSVLRGTWGCNRALQSIKASFWCLAFLWHFRQKLWFPQKAAFLFENALGWVRRAASDEKRRHTRNTTG